MDGRYLSTFFAILLILLGLTVITGWIFHISPLVQVIPGLVGMVFNTALCFMLTGVLILISSTTTSWQRLCQIIISIFILILAMLTFSQDIFDYNLGTDQMFVTPWLQDPNPTPGRMAPNTSIGFMLVASLGLLLPYGNKKSIGVLIQIFIFLILLIALLGMLVYSLKLEFIFTWYRYTRMAVHTAMGFLIASFAWWATLSQTEWYKEFYKGKEDKKIILITGIIFFTITMVAGLGGIAWLTYMNISAVEQSLKDSLQTRVEIIEHEIMTLQKEVNVGVENPFLIDLLVQNKTSQKDFSNILKFFSSKGFSAIQLTDMSGKILFLQGTFITAPDLTIPLDAQKNLNLFWKNGYWLKLSYPIKSAQNQVIGMFVGETALKEVNDSFQDYRGVGNSGEITMCSLTADKNSAICFPTRFTKKIFTMPLFLQGRVLPISYALASHKGIVHAMDYRNHNVIASYQPVNHFPLGIVLKIDTSEIYKPINDQLKFILPLSILFICAGLILLHWQVVPLVRKVVSSEQAAQEARIKLESSLKELSQRNKEINLLREFSANLQSCLTVEESFILITKYGKSLLPNMMGILYLINPSHLYLEVATYWGNFEGMKDIFPIDDCWALRQGIPHKVEDEKNDLICKHISSSKTVYPPMICIPLFAQGTLMGLMFFAELSVELPPDKNQFLVANAVSEQTAIGISSIKLREKLREQSIHDSLTGLYNRRYMQEALEGELLQASSRMSAPLPLSVMILDIDFFKKVNDTFGHDAGDMVLVAISQIIRNCIRAHDFACRYGGEEFVFIMPGTSQTVALERAEQLHQEVARLKLMHNNIELNKITVSIGIANYPADGKNANALIKAADLALYHAKLTGRNKTIAYSELQL